MPADPAGEHAAAMGQIDSRLLELLYGAVDDEARWVDLMDHLRDLMAVESVAAQFLVAARDDLLPLWCTRDRVSQSHAALHDSWANSPANPRFRRPPGPPVELEIDSDHRCPDLTEQDRADLRVGLARCGLGPAFWISQQIDRDRHFTLIFHRPPDDQRDMESADRALLEALAPHFCQAVRLWVKLAANDVHLQLLDQAVAGITTGLVTCDRRLQVRWMNREARRLVGEGEVLRLRGEALAGVSREDHERLQALIAAREPSRVVALGGAGGTTVHVRAMHPAPVANGFVLADQPVLLVMTCPDRPLRHDPDHIARLFGLTPTEAILAADLAAGGTIGSFAAARGVAEGTARLHLKRVLAKTGTSRQAELVRRICASVAGTTA